MSAGDGSPQVAAATGEQLDVASRFTPARHRTAAPLAGRRSCASPNIRNGEGDKVCVTGTLNMKGGGCQTESTIASPQSRRSGMTPPRYEGGPKPGCGVGTPRTRFFQPDARGINPRATIACAPPEKLAAPSAFRFRLFFLIIAFRPGLFNFARSEQAVDGLDGLIGLVRHRVLGKLFP